MSYDKHGKSRKKGDMKKKDSQHKKEKIKSVLMSKYNLSSEEAEVILIKYEKKKLKNNKKTLDKQKENQTKNPNFQNNNKNNNPKNVTNIHNENHNPDKTNKKLIHKPQPEKNSKSTQKFKTTNNLVNNYENDENNATKDNNVDSILTNIIPNYNQQLSIEINHVNLTFEVQKEKVDTIKENVINLIKHKKDEKIKINALKDITFKIYKGEKVGIIGYNGAGKSTLLNVIAGIYPPDTGIINTYGNISPLLSLGAGFDPNYSGRQNIYLNGAVLGYDKQYLESKLNEIIQFSELEKVIDIPIKNYSSGMLAKLGFSIATIVNPDILIIDEILGVGDVNFSKKSADKIRSLMDGGTTVLLVSHSIPQIRELCDKAIWIDNGSVREIGEVNQVCDNYLKDAERASNEQLANITLS